MCQNRIKHAKEWVDQIHPIIHQYEYKWQQEEIKGKEGVKKAAHETKEVAEGVALAPLVAASMVGEGLEEGGKKVHHQVKKGLFFNFSYQS
jgi:hypothetical protein